MTFNFADVAFSPNIKPGSELLHTIVESISLVMTIVDPILMKNHYRKHEINKQKKS